MCVVTTAVAGSATAAFAANAAIAASAVGAGISAYGAYQQQEAANAQAKYQAQVAANNAEIARMEGDYAREQAQRKADEHRDEVRRFIGAQRAAQSASGFIVDKGTNLDLTLDSAALGEIDAMEILHEEGEMAAWRSELRASNAEAQSALYSSSTSNSFTPAMGQLAGGLGQAGGMYYTFTK